MSPLVTFAVAEPQEFDGVIDRLMVSNSCWRVFLSLSLSTSISGTSGIGWHDVIVLWLPVPITGKGSESVIVVTSESCPKIELPSWWQTIRVPLESLHWHVLILENNMLILGL